MAECAGWQANCDTPGRVRPDFHDGLGRHRVCERAPVMRDEPWTSSEEAWAEPFPGVVRAVLRDLGFRPGAAPNRCRLFSRKLNPVGSWSRCARKLPALAGSDLGPAA
jgi:hypothetical protein